MNTPLFVGFPGFLAKWWLAADDVGRYRGIYQWDGAEQAERYARSLWRVLALVSVHGSICYQVLAGAQRDDLAARPDTRVDPAQDAAWWRITGTDPVDRVRAGS